MKKYLICIALVFCICMLYCAEAVGAGDDAGKLRGQIETAAGLALLDLPQWQYINATKPDSHSVYGNPVIDQELLRQQIVRVILDNRLEMVPPLKFRLERPPCLLVVSPRDRIQYLDRVLLTPDLTSEQMAAIESSVDKLGLSSLVMQLGGLGAAFPAIVSPEMGTRQVINAVVEEWAHQFLALRPLGALYLLDCLGIRQPPDIIIMNETLAGMMADEIGGRVYQLYYKDTDLDSKTPAGDIDFSFEMRNTRRTVDMLLRAGEIAAAEQYMEMRKEFFIGHGYSIRKLNQAYFAFHGIYGDDPGAVSPVHDELKALRSRYATLAGFVNDVSGMTDHRQLKEAAAF